MGDFNVAEAAERLAAIISEDLDGAVTGLDLLDWLAIAGYTLRDDEPGDVTIAYQLGYESMENAPVPIEPSDG